MQIYLSGSTGEKSFYSLDRDEELHGYLDSYVARPSEDLLHFTQKGKSGNHFSTCLYGRVSTDISFIKKRPLRRRNDDDVSISSAPGNYRKV